MAVSTETSKEMILRPLLDEAVSSHLMDVFDSLISYKDRLVIATGLAGSGKSLFMNKVRETEPDSKVIVVDNFRYVPDSNWVKRPRDEFIKAILDEIQSVPPTTLIYIDSSLYDAHDPSHARELLLLGLLMFVREIRIFTYETALEQATALIQRSFGRLTGERDAGACPESAESVAKMILKNSSNFEKNTGALKEYVTIAKEFGMLVHHESKNTTILLTPENRLSVSD